MRPLVDALKDVLGSRIDPGGRVLSPASPQELAFVLKVFEDQASALLPQFVLLRTGFDWVASFERQSATVDVGAGVALGKLERLCQDHDLSLGPLSPSMLELDLATFLEGPYAGLRAVRGGRLEPIVLSLKAVTADGSLYRSHPSPRSACGPDLDALFLGGGMRAGVVIGATLRLYPRPKTSRLLACEGPAPQLVGVLRLAVEEGGWPRSAVLRTDPGAGRLEITFAGSHDEVDRDLCCFSALAVRSKVRVVERPAAATPADRGDLDSEISWDALADRASQPGQISLHRISLDTVIASGPARLGMDLSERLAVPSGPWAQLIRSLDPRGVLGAS